MGFNDLYIELPTDSPTRLLMNSENARHERIRMFEKLTTFNLAPVLCVAVPTACLEDYQGAVYVPDRISIADAIPILERALANLKQGSVTPAENATGATPPVVREAAP